MATTADVVICGAGIAGISVAYYLTVQHGVRDVVLVEEGAPLSLTSDKSTECYRNWWPGPGGTMISLMNRSIDLLEDLAQESGNIFHLNRRGYLYGTADPARIPHLKHEAEDISALGAGPLRLHTGQADEPGYVPALTAGFADQPTGADVIVDPEMIQTFFPYLSHEVVAVLHARRAGWFSAQQLGMYMLAQAREHGAKLLNGSVSGVFWSGGRVQSVQLQQGGTILTQNFVNAAGPYLKRVGGLVGVDLPVFCELHLKTAFNDSQNIIPRDAPLLIWSDPVSLDWSEDERALLAESPETAWMLAQMPPGVHMRPEGGADSQTLLLLWDYHKEPTPPAFPISIDPYFLEVSLKGISTMMPGLQVYLANLPRPVFDGGYYTKTRENRPLIGPTPLKGSFVTGAFSGYGLMAACAAGELLAAHITGSPLPQYAPAFSLERYMDPSYQKMLAQWGDTGQL